MSQPLPALSVAAFGIWEMLLIFGVLVLLFGAKKLPMLARGLGSSVRNFKNELEAPEDDSEDDDRG
ncbi:MAG: twin-arginine translocase TatA/TatE family subunit [Gemmatimonadota bacterium]|jgi:sec-independent protein translocase protein TatA